MGLGSGLTTAFFLFSPGIGLYLAVFVFGDQRPFRPSPPPPGSFVTLSVVTLGSIGAHAIVSALFALNDAICDRAVSCFRFDVETNPYAIIARLITNRAIGSVDLSIVLMSLGGLCVATFFAARGALNWPRLSDSIARQRYGWASDILGFVERYVRDRGVDRDNVIVTAFVLTTSSNDGCVLGYEGVLETITLSGDRELGSVLLTDCRRFLVVYNPLGTWRTVVDGDPIAHLYVERSQIANIAFNVYRMETE